MPLLKHSYVNRSIALFNKIQKEITLDFLFIVEEDRATLATGYIRALFLR